MKSQSQGSSGVICCQVNSVARGGIWTCIFSSAVLFWLLPFDNHRKSLYLCLSHGMDARRLKPQDYPVLALVKCLNSLQSWAVGYSAFASIHKSRPAQREIIFSAKEFQSSFFWIVKALMERPESLWAVF